MVVAVHAYHNIAWFSLYCEAAGIFHEKVTTPIKRSLAIDEYKDICFILLTPLFRISNAWWIKLTSIWVVSTDCNESVPKKLLMSLRDNYYMIFLTEGDSDPSVERKRKYDVMTNLGAESDFAALDSNFRWLGVSSNLQNIHIQREMLI